MFTVRRSRHTIPRLLVPVLLTLTTLLIPVGAAASSTSPDRPAPHAIMPLPQPAAGTIVLTATVTGWYNDTGFHDAGNSNYFVGDCISPCAVQGHARNFFVFDLRGVVGTITGATLIAGDPGHNLPFARYSLYGVGSSVSYVAASHTGATNIYADLGTGTVYGAIMPVVNTKSQTIPLNAAGVQAVRRAEAAQIRLAIGGDMPVPAGSGGHLFSPSGAPLSQVQLVLTIR